MQKFHTSSLLFFFRMITSRFSSFLFGVGQGVIFFCLIHEEIGVHHAQVVLIGIGFVFGKLNQVGGGEDLLQIVVYRVGLSHHADGMQDLPRCHLHGLYSFSLPDVGSQDIGQPAVELLLTSL